MKITGIKKQYKKRNVLNGITLDIEKGACVGILGCNGSGKSTLLSILAGVLKADEGSFTLNGDDLLHNNALRTKHISYVPQGNPLILELTAWDNLLLWYEKDVLKKELREGVLAMLGIPDFLKVKVSNMSGGMKKRLAIGCSISNGPDVLLLDEPTAALDLVCKERIYNYIKDYKKSGGRVILTTHDVQELELCDRLYLLKEGVLVPYEFDGNVHRLVGKL